VCRGAETPLTAFSVRFCVVQRDDGLGGAILGRLHARAHALKSGGLHVYTPMSPNNHLTGVKARVEDLVSGRGGCAYRKSHSTGWCGFWIRRMDCEWIEGLALGAGGSNV